MTITVLYNDNNGCDYHRLMLPIRFTEFQSNDKIKFVHHKHISKDETIFDADIIFLSRMFFCDFEAIDKLRKKFGFKIVVDMDDYHKLDYQHMLYKGYKQFNIEKRLLESTQKADMVFVTNDQLYKIYKEFNSNILVVPNALPFDQEPFISNKIPSEKTRFIYVAGSTHFHDLKQIQGLFKRLNTDSQFKQKANFTLCGYNNPKNERENVWNKMESICKIKDAYIRRDSLPLGYYIQHYNYGDISIAPLEDTFFNRGKSQLKFIEAACMKHPFICSNILPYTQDKILDKKGIIFCDKTQDWYKAFKFFLNNPNAVEDFANLNYEYAKTHYNITNSNKLRVQAFKSLLIN